jgi:competence ComEA-like helix-hairpin-helix protein
MQLGQPTETSRSESAANQSRSYLVACILGTILAAIFTWSYLHKQSSTTLVLETRINPNTASAASLMRLPGIGQARAEAVIALREKSAADGNAAFSSAADLRKVRGIGPKTVANISDSVTFEGGGQNGK